MLARKKKSQLLTELNNSIPDLDIVTLYDNQNRVPLIEANADFEEELKTRPDTDFTKMWMEQGLDGTKV